MNEHDLLTELRLCAPSGLPLASLIGSIDPSRAELSSEELESIRQKVDAGSVDAVDASAARTYVMRHLPRFFSMVVVLVFLVGAALFARDWIGVHTELFGEDSFHLAGDWMLYSALWSCLIVCPLMALVVVVYEVHERGRKTSRSPVIVQALIDRGEVVAKIVCAIVLCIVILAIVLFGGMAGFGHVDYSLSS